MAFRSSATSKSNTGGNLTASPAGAAADDYLSGFFCEDVNGQTIGAPSGWTIQYTGNPTVPDSQSFRYADKVAVGSDSFAFTNAGTNESILICAAHSGRATVSPTSFITSTENTTNNASPITANATGGTAAAGDDLIAYFGTDQTTAGVYSFNAASGPGTFTQKQNDGTTSWASASLSILDNYAGGATGNVTETITFTLGNAGWTGVTVAVKQASAGDILLGQGVM